MRKAISITVTTILISLFFACSNQLAHFKKKNIEVINREITAINDSKNSLTLNRKKGSGLAILNDVKFEKGILDLEIKGENNPGKSFVGIAFNIQNDSTYEAVYFRPFNFQSKEKIRREHSMQYIYHPKYTWKYLRTNHEGKYESEFPRQPMPDEWFRVQIKVDDKNVTVYDQQTNTELLSVARLTNQVSNKIGLWTGFDSKGEFKNLQIRK